MPVFIPAALYFVYSSSIVNSLPLKSEVSKERFYRENATFIVRKRGTLAFKGNDPFGS
jgi:hypothetical protein